MSILHSYNGGDYHSTKILNKIYNNVGMFDIVLQTDSLDIQAHKLILSANSEYFRKMFAEDSKITNLEVFNIDGDALKDCVDFCYTGHIDFTTDNIYDIIEISKDFQFKEIEKEGWKVLSEIIDNKNVLEIIQFAIRESNQNVVRTGLKFLFKNIRDIAKLSDFQKLKKKQILKYMKQAKHVSIGTDVEILNVFKSWIDVNSEVREIHSSDFLACFDLKNAPMEFLWNHVRPFCNDAKSKRLFEEYFDADDFYE